MSTSSIAESILDRSGGTTRFRDRRGLALALVLGAQLMIILDMTVVNIALPSIARGLHFSAPSLSWVLNAYTLTFGGLLLLGGRAGDILGRRRVFMTGLALFTAASLAGGLATSAGMLLAARAAQGVGGAIATPAVLAMITTSFAEGRERARALGIYTAVVMGGGSLGLVLGGVITEWVSWRWVLFVNVPIGVVVILAAPLFLPETPRQPGHFDATGAFTSTAGMISLVYGIVRAAADGWTDRIALAALVAAVILLALFLVRESRARQPITPLRLFADRGRAGLLRHPVADRRRHVRDVLLPHPVRPGHPALQPAPRRDLLPADDGRAVRRVPAVTTAGVQVQPEAAHGDGHAARGGRHGLAVPDLRRGTGYLSGVLGPMLLIGAGMGVVFVPLTMASLAGVHPEDSGAAASMVNVMQQVGGSLGLAILVTAYSTSFRDAMANPQAHASRLAQAHDAVVHGMASAFTLAAVLDVLALAVIAVVIRGRGRVRAAAAEPELEMVRVPADS